MRRNTNYGRQILVSKSWKRDWSTCGRIKRGRFRSVQIPSLQRSVPLKRLKLRLESVKLYLTNQNQEKNQTLQYHVLKLTLDRVIRPQIGGVVIKRGGRNGTLPCRLEVKVMLSLQEPS